MALPFQELPLEMLMQSMPWASRWRPISRPSSSVRKPGSSVISSPQMRTEMGYRPSLARMPAMISSMKRQRFSREPPYASVRRL